MNKGMEQLSIALKTSLHYKILKSLLMDYPKWHYYLSYLYIIQDDASYLWICKISVQFIHPKLQNFLSQWTPQFGKLCYGSAFVITLTKTFYEFALFSARVVFLLK